MFFCLCFCVAATMSQRSSVVSSCRNCWKRLLWSFHDVVSDAFFPSSDLGLCLCGSDFAGLMCPIVRCDALMPPM